MVELVAEGGPVDRQLVEVAAELGLAEERRPVAEVFVDQALAAGRRPVADRAVGREVTVDGEPVEGCPAGEDSQDSHSIAMQAAGQ